MLVDTHAHLDMSAFHPDLDGVLQRAREAGVEVILTVGTDVESSRLSLELAESGHSVFGAVGIHPHEAEHFDPQALEALSAMATSHPNVVAWGEIGLDFHYMHSPADRQREAFEGQLARARDLRLPVVIHDRDAHGDVLRILEKMGKGEGLGVIHCFSGDMPLAAKFIALGYCISIPGTVTYPKAVHTQEVARTLPLERLLLETDAPYLAPVPMRGRRNEPAYVVHTAREIARLRGISLDVLAAATTENACRLFGLPR